MCNHVCMHYGGRLHTLHMHASAEYQKCRLHTACAFVLLLALSLPADSQDGSAQRSQWHGWGNTSLLEEGFDSESQTATSSTDGPQNQMPQQIGARAALVVAPGLDTLDQHNPTAAQHRNSHAAETT
jgi:hypothetical protein